MWNNFFTVEQTLLHVVASENVWKKSVKVAECVEWNIIRKVLTVWILLYFSVCLMEEMNVLMNIKERKMEKEEAELVI